MRNNLIKKFIHSFAVLSCAMTFATLGKAQITNRLKFETSFDFIVRNQTFPAGKYTLERLSPADPKILILRAVNGGVNGIIVTYLIDENESAENSQIIFDHHNEGYYLTKIQLSNSFGGYEIFLNLK